MYPLWQVVREKCPACGEWIKLMPTNADIVESGKAIMKSGNTKSYRNKGYTSASNSTNIKSKGRRRKDEADDGREK